MPCGVRIECGSANLTVTARPDFPFDPSSFRLAYFRRCALCAPQQHGASRKKHKPIARRIRNRPQRLCNLARPGESGKILTPASRNTPARTLRGWLRSVICVCPASICGLRPAAQIGSLASSRFNGNSPYNFRNVSMPLSVILLPHLLPASSGKPGNLPSVATRHPCLQRR